LQPPKNIYLKKDNISLGDFMAAKWIVLTIIIVLLTFSILLPFNVASKTVPMTVVTIKVTENSAIGELQSIMTILIDRIHAISPQSRVEGKIHEGRITLIVKGMEVNKTALLDELVTRRGRIYIEFQGNVIATNSDILKVSNPVIENLNGKWTWKLPFRISDEAAQRFANAVKGKTGYPVDIFVDPPENCLIVMAPELYRTISSSNFDAMIPSSISFSERIRRAFNVTVIPYFRENESSIKALAERSKRVVLIGTTGDLEKKLRMTGITVVSFNVSEQNPTHPISRTLGLLGSYSLGKGMTTGQPVMDMMIASLSSTREEALKESTLLYAILSSKPLPAQLKVISIEHTTTTSSFSSTLKAPNSKKICGTGSLMLLSVFLLLVLCRICCGR